MVTRVNVYVVLSRSRTVLSRTIALATRDEFTHSSLALDQGLDLMFSFGRRRAGNPFVGCFRRERFDDGLYRGMDVVPGVVLAVPVTPEQHEAIRVRITEFLLDSHAFSYNVRGLVGARFGRGHEAEDRFFCSEFVYHVLHGAGVCDLGVERWQVRPQTLLDLPGRVVFRGDLKDYVAAHRTLETLPSLTFAPARERVPG